jgi:hypothetical protein
VTEFELISLIIMQGEEAAYHSMNYIALLFAYCLVAFFAAEKLTRVQVWMVTLVYSSVLFAPITANLRAVNNLRNLSVEFSQLFPNSFMEYSVWAVRTPVLLIVYLSAWLLSIVFMMQWRRQQRH